MAQFVASNVQFELPEGGEIFRQAGDDRMETVFVRVGDEYKALSLKSLGMQAGTKYFGDEAIIKGREVFEQQTGLTIGQLNVRHIGDLQRAGLKSSTSLQNLEEFQNFVDVGKKTPFTETIYSGGTREATFGALPGQTMKTFTLPSGQQVQAASGLSDVSAATAQPNFAKPPQQIGQPAETGGIAEGQTIQTNIGSFKFQGGQFVPIEAAPGQEGKGVFAPGAKPVTPTPEQTQVFQKQPSESIETYNQRIAAYFAKTGGKPEDVTKSGNTLASLYNMPKASDVIRDMEATLSSSLLKEEQDVDDIETQIEARLKTRKGPHQLLQEEFERRGITTQKSILKEFDTRIKDMQKSVREIPENLQKTLEDVGVTQAQLNRIAARDTQRSMSILTEVLVERNALADEINEAVGFAQQFVNTVLESEANHLALLEWQMKREDMDVAELKTEQKDLIKQALVDRKELMRIALDAIKGGYDQTVIDDLMDAGSLENAIKILANNQPEQFEYTQTNVGGTSYEFKKDASGKVIDVRSIVQGEIDGGRTESDTIKFTNDELKTLQAIGAENFQPQFQNILMNALTASERTKFMRDWKAEQERRGQSIDPEVYLEEWALKQETSDTDFDLF